MLSCSCHTPRYRFLATTTALQYTTLLYLVLRQTFRRGARPVSFLAVSWKTSTALIVSLLLCAILQHNDSGSLVESVVVGCRTTRSVLQNARREFRSPTCWVDANVCQHFRSFFVRLTSRVLMNYRCTGTVAPSQTTTRVSSPIFPS